MRYILLVILLLFPPMAFADLPFQPQFTWGPPVEFAVNNPDPLKNQKGYIQNV